MLSKCYDHQARDWGSRHHWFYTNKSLLKLNFITLLLDDKTLYFLRFQ